MTEAINLKEFLQTGQLGQISIGQPENEILPILGMPDYAGGVTNKNKRPTLFSYGDVEFYFDHDTRLLTCINLNYLSFWSRKYPIGSEHLQVNAWVLAAGLDPDDLMQHLHQENIDFCEVDPINPNTRQLFVNSIVNLVFNNPGDDCTGLCKLWAGN